MRNKNAQENIDFFALHDDSWKFFTRKGKFYATLKDLCVRWRNIKNQLRIDLSINLLEWNRKERVRVLNLGKLSQMIDDEVIAGKWFITVFSFVTLLVGTGKFSKFKLSDFLQIFASSFQNFFVSNFQRRSHQIIFNFPQESSPCESFPCYKFCTRIVKRVESDNLFVCSGFVLLITN